MTPELIAALRERVVAGRSESEIMAELHTAGYADEVAKAAYAAATHPLTPATLPGVDELFSRAWRMCLCEWRVFLYTLGISGATLVVGTLLFFLVMSGLGATGEVLVLAGVLGMLGIPLATAFFSFVLLRALLYRQAAEPFSAHLLVVSRQFISLAVVTVYMTIITQVGYQFLIIPGVLASIYFLFVIPVTLRGEGSGLSSLVVSVRLVHGRFWAVLWRFLVLNLLVGMVVVLLYAVMTVGFMSTGLFAVEPYLDWRIAATLLAFVLPLFLLIGYWSNCVLVTLFEMLRAVPSPVALRISDRALKTLFGVIIGLVVVVLAIAVFAAGFLGYGVMNSGW